MNARDFFDKVKLMRKYQKAYSKHRSSADLARSKKIEKEIDAEIERVNSILGTSPKLNF